MSARKALPSALPSTQPDLRLADFLDVRVAFHTEQAGNTHISAVRRADHTAKAEHFAGRATRIRERASALRSIRSKQGAPMQTNTLAADIAAQPATRFVSIGDGCIRDTQICLDADGTRYMLEWTPTLNSEEQPGNELIPLIEACTLAGGGFKAPSVDELLTRVDRTQRGPATFEALKADTKSDWYVTSEPLASSPLCAWFVLFGGGYVGWSLAGGFGFARGVRRVVVSPGQ